MKLKELLTSLPSEKTVGIGSQSGYVIFAEAGNTALIERAFVAVKNMYENRLVDFEARLDYAKSIKYTKDPSGAEYKRWKAERKSIIDGYKETLKRSKTYISTYQNPLDREVIEWFNTIDGDIAIIVPGLETGKYWYKSEYNKDKRKVS